MILAQRLNDVAHSGCVVIAKMLADIQQKIKLFRLKGCFPRLIPIRHLDAAVLAGPRFNRINPGQGFHVIPDRPGADVVFLRQILNLRKSLSAQRIPDCASSVRCSHATASSPLLLLYRQMRQNPCHFKTRNRIFFNILGRFRGKSHVHIMHNMDFRRANRAHLPCSALMQQKNAPIRGV